MALCVLSASSVPRICARTSSTKPIGVTRRASRPKAPTPHRLELRGRSSVRRLNAAGLSEIEPDLNEDPVDRWATNSVDAEDFKYGEYDEHHTYHEGEEKGTFWGAIAEDIAAVEPPTGFQGLISWLFLPAVAAGMYFDVPGEYLFIGAALFTVIFCIIEMDKPDKPHNFEPQIYNMERGARDKLIADYNTMDIWDFNEKYGDLWDFTVIRDDITKRIN
ncbi:photosynthetic NDH subunit of subcomplex B 5, chloroplastic [Rhodamnia argentea]|uniref:Photosynthetic NDH subunit of subcomplex B 5, chloroplastic n=1 Tax=Rhodamnia argentea TaxID=178133 RepID=A0A8B8Q4C1_9MYRT|nr:photosynthetic NDH subunit of subcomplex B 5, chloroplastic [Rhodamnia argentea]XP_030541222.2 photosynthetic NDH subunit of subcomplex B 5, chloroplastic [Rhodamnia argentea]